MRKSILSHHYSPWTLAGLIGGLLSLVSCLQAQVTPPTPQLPYVVLIATDPTALEGTSSGAFTFIREGSDTNDLVVDLAISGTASNGVDYATIKDQITIPTGSQALDILITPIVDTMKGGNKTVALSVRTNANYRVGHQSKATVLIVDDVFNIPPPVVTLTSPTNGSAFDDPQSITLQAAVSDTGVSIAYVSFYANDTFLGKSANNSFSLVWSNPPAGHFTLFARAVNQVQESALSAPVEITVTDAVPVVTITNPVSGQNFGANEDITIQANATDGDDAIRSVSFYANNDFLGSVSTVPYALVWSNAPAGTFVLRAKAVDQSGDSGYSTPVIIDVSTLPGQGPALKTRALKARRIE